MYVPSLAVVRMHSTRGHTSAYLDCWIVKFVTAVGHGLKDILETVTKGLFTPERGRSCGTFMKKWVL